MPRGTPSVLEFRFSTPRGVPRAPQKRNSTLIRAPIPMILLQAPATLPNFSQFPQSKLFLAGGISGASDWQSEMISQLETPELLLFNPRREDYPHDDPGAGREQVRWEHGHLRLADAVSFWFVAETLCPITLYEAI